MTDQSNQSQIPLEGLNKEPISLPQLNETAVLPAQVSKFDPDSNAVILSKMLEDISKMKRLVDFGFASKLTELRAAFNAVTGAYVFHMSPQIVKGNKSMHLVWDKAGAKAPVSFEGHKALWFRVYQGSMGNYYLGIGNAMQKLNRLREFLREFNPATVVPKEENVQPVVQPLNQMPPSVVLASLSGQKYHKDLPRVYLWVRTKKPVWLWGPPAGGKNVMAEQIAKVLGVPYYPIYLGPTTTESKIVGFMNAGAGTYVPGLVYEPYGKGGLVYFDEIDVADPQVLIAANSLVENDAYRFPNGEYVKRHENLYFLAGANTKGFGAEGGMKRNSQDAATLSRFIKVRLDYDEHLEMSLCRNKGWVQYVQKVRKFVHNLARGAVAITPRASFKGDAALEQGLSRAEVMESCLMADMGEDTKKSVLANCGTFL